MQASEKEISRVIENLLAVRGTGKSICPSEAARKLATDDEWRMLMEPVREVARYLARQGVVEFTQRGKVVDPDNHKGPVRLRLCRNAMPPK